MRRAKSQSDSRMARNSKHRGEHQEERAYEFTAASVQHNLYRYLALLPVSRCFSHDDRRRHATKIQGVAQHAFLKKEIVGSPSLETSASTAPYI